MDTLTVSLPYPKDIKDFCEQQDIETRSLFQLTWALILHHYFETASFNFYDRSGCLKTSPTKSDDDDLIEKTVVEYDADYAATVRVGDALQKGVQNQIIHEIDRKEFDGASQKVATGMKVFHDTTTSNFPFHTSADSSENACVPCLQNPGSLPTDQIQITVIVGLEPSNASCSIAYNKDIVSTFRAESITRAFERAFQSIISSSQTETVATINFISDHDESQIFDWNSSPLYDVEHCLHHLFHQSVLRNPNSEAIVSWDGHLTYDELDKLSSKLAHYLIDAFGLGPEQIVPLCFEKSIWAVVSMLAVLKTGAAYSCMDPAHPADRKQYIIKALQAKFIMTSDLYSKLFHGKKTVIVNNESILRIPKPTTIPIVSVGPQNSMVVAFTSGTTGTPKGIMHTHMSMCSGIVGNSSMQGLNNSDMRVFQWAAYTFDVSMTEIYTPLIYGGVCCIPSDEERLNNVQECMTRMRVNWAYFTPSFARFVRRFDLPPLRTFIMGGESVTTEDVSDWVGRTPRVLNAYGPAESITWYLGEQKDPCNVVSFGYPTSNLLGWIVDPADAEKLQPLGAVGELLFETPGLFKSYLNDPKRTETVLIEPPSWRHRSGTPANHKMYKSGDLVRYLPDGSMTYVGRKDRMVKLRGQRMELEEVEIAMRRSLPKTAEVAADVIIPSGDIQDPVLVAFLCLNEARLQKSKLMEVKQHLQVELAKSLPGFMVPRIYIPMETMPYNTSRKLDRGKLRDHASSMTIKQLSHAISSIKEDEMRPAASKLTPMELLVQKLWADALLLDPKEVNLTDNFFSLGGTSMATLKMTATGRAQGISISYADVFRTTDLRALAQVTHPIEKVEEEVIKPFSLIQPADRTSQVLRDVVRQCKVDESEIEDVYPQVPQQEGLWALSLIEQGAYMAQFLLTLKPEVDLNKFFSAWKAMVSTYAILRTRFVQSRAQAYQVVLKEGVQWNKASSLEAYLKTDHQKRVDFGKPLVRYAIIPKNGTHIVVWSMHHALFDGESTPTFLNAVARTYAGSPPGPESVTPFKAFINHIQSIDQASSEKYWISQFEDSRLIHFPTSPSHNYRPSSSSLLHKTIALSRKRHSKITTPNLLRGVWGLTISNASSSLDVGFGETLAGRSLPLKGIEDIIGPTFVTLPRRARIDPSLSICQYLESVQKGSTELTPFEHTGMQRIRKLSPQCYEACQFQNILIIQTPDDKTYEGILSLDDSTGGMQRFNSHPLMWVCFLTPDGIDIAVSFDTHVINVPQVEDLANSFEEYIHILSTEDDRRIDSLMDFGSTKSMGTPSEDFEMVEQEVEQANSSVLLELRKAWSEVLYIDVKEINDNDEFFSSGGNSISAMGLVAAARDVGVTFSVADIFRYPRLMELASVAKPIVEEIDFIPPFSLLGAESRAQEIRAEAVAQCGISNDEIENILPATPLQSGLLAATQSKRGAHVSQGILTVPEKLSAAEYMAVWDRVWDRYASLRTRIIQTDKHGTFQIVVKRKLEWDSFTNLEEYVVKDRDVKTLYGSRLSRFAISKGTKPVKVVWTAHHSSYDAYTLRTIFRSVDLIHQKRTLPPTTPFDDFIKFLMEQNEATTKAYWQNELEGYTKSPFPALPSITYKPNADTVFVERIQIPRKPRSTITTPSILRAAWAILVSQYSNTNDVAFGLTLSGRNAPVPKIENVVEPTITTVPVRLQVEDNKPAFDWLQSVQEKAIEMIPFEQTGITQIKAFSRGCRDACSFQTLLVIQTTEQVTANESTIVDLFEVQNDFAYFNDYSVMLQCSLEDGGAEVLVSFDANVIDENQVHRYVKQFEHIIHLLSLEDQRQVKQLKSVNKFDFQDILTWNKNLPRAVSTYLHDLVKPGFATEPQKLAIEAWNGSFSYAELDNISTILAKHLKSQGIKSETIVPLCFEKSKYAIVAILGVLKAGGAFLFLDPTHPGARHAALLDKIGANLVLTTDNNKALFDHAVGRHVIILDAELIENARDSVSSVADIETLRPNSLAYVILTSGTTGVPKAIAHDHISMSSSVLSHARMLNVSKDTRAIQFCAYTFDPIISEIFLTLMHGGTLCIPSDEERLIGATDFMNRLRVNWAWLTPSFARLLDWKDDKRKEIPTLKTLVTGGEKVTLDDEKNWSRKVKLLQIYGPSECEGWVIGNLSDGSQRLGEVGYTCGAQGWVLDSINQLLPVGAVGEIALSGPSVARGYLQDPKKSASVFIDGPEWLPRIEPYGRLYKTGDLGRMNTNGTITVLGRMDKQVKLNGQRMELGEVETHLKRNLPPLGDAAVDILKLEDTTKLVSFVSLPDGFGDSQTRALFQTLQTELLGLLPPFMVPKIYLPFSPLPINSNGKLDRAKLLDHAYSLSIKDLLEFSGDTVTGLGSSLNADEKVALEISKKVIELTGAVDEAHSNSLKGRDFVLAYSGLDSIATVLLASFIKKTFKVTIPIAGLIAHNVRIRDVARIILESGTGKVVNYLSGAEKIWADYEELNSQLQATQPQVRSYSSLPNAKTVFLTGATGFLGIQILRELLFRSSIHKVIAHVRADNAQHAKRRILLAARKARWWSPGLSSRVEVWTGDLAKPRLGLEEEQWGRLGGTQNSPPGEKIDAIIHNGAVVHWDSSYESMRAANVLSTVQLLTLLSSSPTLSRLTFISGGQSFNHEAISADPAHLATVDGYSQGKLVSELLVSRYAERHASRDLKVNIVKPGAIVGTSAEGVSNTDDFLWRVVAGVVSIGGFNATEKKSWMSVTGVDQVAALIADRCLSNEKEKKIMTRIMDGLTVGEFWSIVNHALGDYLQPLRLLQFIDALRGEIEKSEKKHPMWPVMHWLEANDGKIGDDSGTVHEQNVKRDGITSAVRKSVEYLASIGYLDKDGDWSGESGHMEVFKRSGWQKRT